MAEELGISQTELEFQSASQIDWPDTSLGCPKIGEVYTDVITPGFILKFDVQGQQGYIVHSNKEGTSMARCSSS